MAAVYPIRTWPFLVVCAAAGALAVPPHALISPLSAVVAGLVGLLGLRVWRWSRLPSATRVELPRGAARVVEPVLWMGLGLAVGLVLLMVIRLAIEPVLPAAGARIEAAGELPVWRRGLIIYVAAVTEELMFRLLLLSLIAGLIAKWRRLAAGVPDRGSIAVANGVSALAFSAVHLPAWSGVGPLGAGLVLTVMALNGLGGAVFGYLFARRGIGAAMWAHAGGDCAIQLLGPLTG